MNSPDVFCSVKQCSYSPREGYGPSVATRIPSSISSVCAHHVSGDPKDSGGIQRSTCQRFVGKYFGTRRSSMHWRITFPCASRSVQRPPIQVRREPPQTTRKCGSLNRFRPPVRVIRCRTSEGASCVSRVTRITEMVFAKSKRLRRGGNTFCRPVGFSVLGSRQFDMHAGWLSLRLELVAGRNGEIADVGSGTR